MAITSLTKHNQIKPNLAINLTKPNFTKLNLIKLVNIKTA